MRDIEFRGKATHTGEWVYGDLLTKEIDTPEDRVTGFVGIQMDSGPASGGFFYVPLETVGQYTGLKDKNGKKIFEGDIVRYQKRVYVIKWVDGLCAFEMCYKNNKFRLSMWCFGAKEIIGNIHDNPELLAAAEEYDG